MRRPSATVPLAPAEGWLTLVCVLLVALTMAWVVDDARWVLGRADYLDHLVLAAVGGVLAGFLGPKLGFGRWATYLVGSLAAAIILPLPTALVAVPAADSIATLYRTTAEAVGTAWVDLAILGNASTPQYLHYILAIGLLVWATSMFASYAVFGHRRPLNGVIAVGLFVVSNMALTSNEQLPFLVLFSLASLFLLIRSHVFDEQSEWIRRQIGDPGSVSSVYLRGGSLFIAVAVTLSFVLTMTAASAPLAGAFDGVEDGLINISRSVQRFLPTGGSNRTLGIGFGSSAQVSQQWTTDGSPAVSIRRDPADIGQYYWRAVTYDRLEFRGWSQTGTTTNVVSPGDPIFDQQAEDVDPTGRHPFSFTVTPAGYRSSTVLSPSIPVTADAPVRLTTVGPDGYYASIEREGDGAAPYTVTALTEAIGNEPGELNVNALRAAGTDYPRIDRGPLPGGPGQDARRGRPGAQGKDHRRGAESCPDRPGESVGRGTPFLDLRVRHGHSRSAVRGPVDGRLLHDLQEGVLPLLRGHDGHPAARHGRAHAYRGRVPARHRRGRDRDRADRRQRRPLVGRGLLPGLWLADLRSDRWWDRPGCAAAVRTADRERGSRFGGVDPAGQSPPGPRGADRTGRTDRDVRRRQRRVAWTARRGRCPPAADRRRCGVRPVAARPSRRDHGRRRIRHGHQAGQPARVRSAADPDHLRIRRGPRRRPARGQTGTGDRRAGQGRSRSMRARSLEPSAWPVSSAHSGGCVSSCSVWRSGAGPAAGRRPGSVRL